MNLTKRLHTLDPVMQQKIEQLHNELRAREARAEWRSRTWEVIRPVVWTLSLTAAFIAGGVAGTIWPVF